MKYILIILPLIFCSFGLAAQSSFSFSYPVSPDTADGGLGVVQMNDGYLIGCGTVNQKNGREYADLLKIGWEGELMWNKSYYWEPYQPDIAFHNPVAVVWDKIYMACQTMSDSNQINYQLFCLTFEGDTLWSKIYPEPKNDFLFGITNLMDSTLVLYGNKGTTDVLDVARLVKVDKDGNVLWDKTYGDEFGRSFLRDVKELPDGSLILASTICHYGSNCLLERNPALTKVDKNGNKLWTKTYNQSESDVKTLVVPLNNGGYAMAWTRDTTNSSIDPYPPIIYFLDSLGNIEGEYDGFVRSGNYYLTKLKPMSNGDMLGVGITLVFNDDGGTVGGWLFRLSQQGELIWERRISDRRYPDLYGQFFDAIEAPDEGVIAVGNISTNGFQNAEVWIVKLDSNGCAVPGCTGDSIYFTPVAEVLRHGESYFDISPNPAKTYFTVQVNSALPLPFSQLEIMDLSGRRHLLMPIKSNMQAVETANLSNGLYFVRLLHKGRPLQTKKLVVMK